jgi:hypothetical protein
LTTTGTSINISWINTNKDIGVTQERINNLIEYLLEAGK